MANYIVLNLKTYVESMGENGVRLARVADKVAEESGASIILCPNLIDLRIVVESVHKVGVFAQHVDPYEPGAHTGSIIPEAILKAGAKGTLINHSERRMDMSGIKNAVERCRKLGLTSLVCAATIEEVKSVARLNPDIIAIEPPELIGTGVSVSTANPDIIRNSVKTVSEISNNIPVLCGAGISTGEDVKRAIELGAKGVLLASAYVKSNDPGKLLREMVDAL